MKLKINEVKNKIYRAMDRIYEISADNAEIIAKIGIIIMMINVLRTLPSGNWEMASLVQK